MTRTQQCSNNYNGNNRRHRINLHHALFFFFSLIVICPSFVVSVSASPPSKSTTIPKESNDDAISSSSSSTTTKSTPPLVHPNKNNNKSMKLTSNNKNSLPTTTTTTTIYLDLSYMHRITATTLAEVIRENLYRSDVTNGSIMDIDITSSMISKGLRIVLDSLLTTPSNSKYLHLTARKNSWTPYDATIILTEILSKQKEQQDQLVKEKEKQKEQEKEQDIDDSSSSSSSSSNQNQDLSSSSSETTTTATISEVKNENDDDQTSKEIEQDSSETTTTTTTTTTINEDQEEEEKEDDDTITAKSTKDNEQEEAAEEIIEEEELVPAKLTYLDIGWNNFNEELPGLKPFSKVLQQLIENPNYCPTTICLDVCGLGPAICRALGKGLMNRYENWNTSIKNDNNNDAKKKGLPKPLSLYLSRNEMIGDAGAAAISAAMRTVYSMHYYNDEDEEKKKKTTVNDNGSTKNEESQEEINASTDEEEDEDLIVFDILDLSACGIGDAGAEALAIALEGRVSGDKNKNNDDDDDQALILPPCCIRHLDLSNNQITDKGAAALGRALCCGQSHRRKGLESLDLSNNKKIGDVGAAAIARAMEKGMIQNIKMRSCHIQADGAADFAKAIKQLRQTIINKAAQQQEQQQEKSKVIKIDLSGNPLGILRKPSKSDGSKKSKYSASALKDKASKTTAQYMNFIGKRVQKGLKDLGVQSSSTSGFNDNTLESDDEAENDNNMLVDDDLIEDGTPDPFKVRCGALAFANAFIDSQQTSTMKDDTISSIFDIEDNDDDGNDNYDMSSSSLSSPIHIELGLRRCFLDTRASDALAAVIQTAKEKLSLDISIDVNMNNVLEDDVISALKNENNDDEYDEYLSEMAERHLDAMEALQVAKERAIKAAEAAAARVQAEAMLDAAWGSPGVDYYDDGDEEDDYDNDYDYNNDEYDDYDQEEDEDDYWDSDADYDDDQDDDNEYDYF